DCCGLPALGGRDCPRVQFLPESRGRRGVGLAASFGWPGASVSTQVSLLRGTSARHGCEDYPLTKVSTSTGVIRRLGLSSWPLNQLITDGKYGSFPFLMMASMRSSRFFRSFTFKMPL